MAEGPRNSGAAWALGLAVILSAPLLAGPAAAQLGEPTPEEAKLGRPSPNTAITDTTPPPSDPRDFSGMWRNPPMARPPGGAVAQAPPPSSNVTVNNNRARSRYCLPNTMLLAGGEAGTEILQRSDEMWIITEEHHNNRRIYIDQPHTLPFTRSINGDSVAHWDGDTLVIETAGFIGYGVSSTLLRTERLSKADGGRMLVDEITYADRSGRPAPAATTARLTWAPGTKILEYICEDGGDAYMGEYK